MIHCVGYGSFYCRHLSSPKKWSSCLLKNLDDWMQMTQALRLKLVSEREKKNWWIWWGEKMMRPSIRNLTCFFSRPLHHNFYDVWMFMQTQNVTIFIEFRWRRRVVKFVFLLLWHIKKFVVSNGLLLLLIDCNKAMKMKERAFQCIFKWCLGLMALMMDFKGM